MKKPMVKVIIKKESNGGKRVTVQLLSQSPGFPAFIRNVEFETRADANSQMGTIIEQFETDVAKATGSE